MIVNSKVKMLVNDSSKLGPGCYDVSDNLLKKSPKVKNNY